MDRKPDQELERRSRRLPHGSSRSSGPDDFFGLDVNKMSPKAQVTASLAVLIPVTVAGIMVLTLFSSVWWLVFVFGWTIFPAFGLLVRGIAGLSEGTNESSTANGKEHELLRALRDYGELTPTRAAMETSLTVAEADKMLKELAEGGHLDVRVRGGGIFYALWEPDYDDVERKIEG